METHLGQYLSMILSLNENGKPTTSINKCFFNERLVMFDREMKVFL